MNNVHFYPRLTDELIASAGVNCLPYEFSYLSADGESLPLSLVSNRIDDPAEIWKASEDGLSIAKRLVVEYPDALRGHDGVAPKNARVLPCILWVNSGTSTAGVIMPTEVLESPRIECEFVHEFEPGTLKGRLVFKLVLYICEAAAHVEADEKDLMNEAGVILGEMEPLLILDLDGEYEDFPIEEYADEGGPLWRMRFESWEDPREDAFGNSSFSLLLNSKHPECPRIAKGKTLNQPLLEEILCEAYYLLFEKVREFDDGSAWGDMITDSNLVDGSICSVLHWFSQRGDEAFDWSSPESRMLSLKKIMSQCFSDGGNNG